MKRSRFDFCGQTALSCVALFMSGVVWPAPRAEAHHTGAEHFHVDQPQFQKPSIGAHRPNSTSPTNQGLKFQRVSRSQALTPQDAAKPQRNAPRRSQGKSTVARAKPLAEAPRVAVAKPAAANPTPRRPAFVVAAERQSYANNSERTSSERTSYRDENTAPASHGQVVYDLQSRGRVRQASYCDTCIGQCDCEPTCGILDPGCGMIDPGCGCPDPGCGCAEPACGICEPGCGIIGPSCGICEPACGVAPGCGCPEPSCGCDGYGCGDGVGCGSCVARPGPDYDCIPICIPKFKDLTFWGGVHGFKGPRDVPGGVPPFGGPGDGNFGFQEGVNISGRAPFIGLLFPQLSYQLGYQAVQSRLSGVSSGAGSTNDRSQQFVTGGFFRRAPVGLQYGLVFDLMRDDLMMQEDFHQIRYEISMKSPKGREFGFFGATHTNTARVAMVNYQAVDQYAGFYRWHFRNGGVGRLWGGASNDNEGIFGGDFEVPLNDRWSLQSGFNYLITDRDSGPDGAREESWNVGMNLIWHWGRTAKRGRNSPFRPLFRVADNGWMFIDQEP